MQLVEKALRRDASGKVIAAEHLYSTVELSGTDIPCTLVAATPEEARQKKIPWMYDVTCGVLFIDELHDYLPAREFDKLPPEARKFWSRHRHRDLHIISNTQHPSFVDKYCRIITDRVILAKLVRLPLLGALVEKTVRPPDPCLLQPNFPHARRDALGDRHNTLARFLHMGSMIRWNEYAPSILNDEESLDMSYLEAQGIKPKSAGFLLFDMKYASMATKTVHMKPPGAATQKAMTKDQQEDLGF
ncbi:MAG: hypothetical protein RLZZ324_49 [Candidatus Parcubacteria bacterium]|jgi:hypothetical protein